MALSKNVSNLVARWRDIQARGGQLDYEVATFAADARALYPAWDLFWAFFSETLGERETAVVKKYLSMADAVKVVTDPAVWRAVGWREIRNVARIESKSALSKACARIVEQSRNRRSAKVGPSVVDKILAEEAPETFVPKAAIPETPKDREQNRAEAEKRAAPKVEAKAEAVLAKAIRRLVGNGYAFIADLLTAEERQAAGLTVKKAKARAS